MKRDIKSEPVETHKHVCSPTKLLPCNLVGTSFLMVAQTETAHPSMELNLHKPAEPKKVYAPLHNHWQNGQAVDNVYK